MSNKRTVDDLEDSQGKKVLVYYNFNVLLKEGVTRNYNRIDGAIPTTKKLLDQGAKAILCSYLDKLKGEPVPEMSPAPVAPALSERPGVEVKFVDDPKVARPETQKVAAELKDGETLLLQNTRYRVGEIKSKDGDAASEAYVRELAGLCDDIFVNDTFGTAHRAHCSNVGAIRFTRENVVGYLVKKEIRLLGQTVENPVRPFATIPGDVKVSDKTNVIDNLLDKVDTLIIDGGMTYTSAKVQGQKIGSSLCEVDKLDYTLKMIEKAEGKGIKLLLPVDHVEGKEFFSDAEYKVVSVIDAGWLGSDIGPKTIALYKEVLQGVKTVVWNGPMGVFEFSNSAEGTPEVCRAVIGLVNATAVIGGDDSVNAVKRLDSADKMTHISAGSGASLGFLEGKELPDVAAADNRA